MPWLLLLASAPLEAVWATALGQSDGLRDPAMTTFFLIALALSMGGLALAVRTIASAPAMPCGPGSGPPSRSPGRWSQAPRPSPPLKALLLVGTVGAVIGLKLLPSPSDADDTGPA